MSGTTEHLTCIVIVIEVLTTTLAYTFHSHSSISFAGINVQVDIHDGNVKLIWSKVKRFFFLSYVDRFPFTVMNRMLPKYCRQYCEYTKLIEVVPIGDVFMIEACPVAKNVR